MNSWNNEQFIMPNLMGASPIMQNIIPSNGIAPNTMPLAPPMCMMADMNVNNMSKSNQNSAKFTGSNNQETRRTYRENNDEGNQNQIMFDDNPRGSDRARDRTKRPRSDERDRNDRFDRNKFGLDKNRSDRRRTKWDTNDKLNNDIGLENMVAHGNMMSYSNLINQPIDITNIQNLTNMQTMGNVTGMSGMTNIPGMMSSLMSGIMDQNMLMQQTMPMIPSQPIFLKNAILMPPNLGVSMPPRREKPPGCHTIFVGGLPSGVSEEIVREIFKHFGTIVDIKWHKQGVCHVRFDRMECVEQSFCLSGFRFKYHDQMDTEATTVFIDYALNRDDQNEYERNKRKREVTPPRIEPYSFSALSTISEKIKSDTEFIEAAPTLASWLERGECNKRNSNTFYSLIQTTNNQIRRLFNEKMQVEEEYQSVKNKTKEKFFHILTQFEQIAKILKAAKHQRVSDHFTKQQRRNVDMWLKMTEELQNLREEFNSIFDEEDSERAGKTMISMEKYEQLKTQNENLTFELEGYKNEAHLAKNEAERKFEKFKAHFIAQQALQNTQGQAYSPHSTSPLVSKPTVPSESPGVKTHSPLSSTDEKLRTSGLSIPCSEAKLISLLTAFLMVHPLGATSDYLVSYVKSIMPDITLTTVNHVLQTYTDVFRRKTNGVGANIEHRWHFITFESIKNEIVSVIID